MTNYPWSANPFKLQRAIAAVGTADEATLKAEYVKMGGLLIEDSEPKVATVVANEPITAGETFAGETAKTEEKPKKPAKKTAKK